MLVIRAGFHKILHRKANREDPKQSDEGLHCMCKPFLKATSVHNFRIFTVYPETTLYALTLLWSFTVDKNNVHTK